MNFIIMKFSTMNTILILLSISMHFCLEYKVSDAETYQSKSEDHSERQSKSSSKKVYFVNDKNIEKYEGIKENYNKDTNFQSNFIEKQKPKESSNSLGKSETQENPVPIYLKNEKLKEDKKFEINEKCKKKSGYIYFIQDKNNKQVSLSPVYMHLDSNNISLFKTHELSSLFSSIKLSDIFRISQESNMKSLNCFDVQKNDKIETNNKGDLSKSIITLCAKDKKSFDSWVDAIGIFKECNINVQNIDGNKKVLLDFQKINEVEKNKLTNSEEKPKDNSLYYGNTPTHIKNPVIQAKETAIHKTLNKIYNDIKKESIRKRQLHRQMIEKLKQAKRTSEDMHQKQELIKKMMQKRQEKEEKKENKIKKIEEQNKEIELLKAVSNKIKKNNIQDIKDFKKEMNNKLKTEKLQTNKEALSVSNLLIKSKMIKKDPKLMDFSMCTDQKLMNFNDLEYVKNSCNRLYGLNVSFKNLSKLRVLMNVPEKKTFAPNAVIITFLLLDLKERRKILNVYQDVIR
jgi:hypothetical protein